MRSSSSGRRAWGVACLVLALGAGSARGQSYEVVHTFSAEAGNPESALLRTADGKLYGTSFTGGFWGQGSVFVLTPDGGGGFTFTTLHEFDGSDGINPYSGLIQGTDGNLYGTTTGGGALGRGTAFRITPSGTLTTLHSFANSEAYRPYADLVQGTDGDFYGTSVYGGSPGVGTAFKMSPSGAVTTLHTFSSSDGAYPYAALLESSDGNFYGTTDSGGANGRGTVFRISPSGAFATLYSFAGSDGANPRATLVQDENGDFYGTTWRGGASGAGTAFKITLSGALTTLHSFAFADGSFPLAGLVEAADGNFLGTTQSGGPSGKGTVFRMTPAGSVAILHGFGLGAGLQPDAGVVFDAEGNLYGTTNRGSSGPGTVFQLTGSGALNNLHSFAYSDAAYPSSSLLQASDGNLYGTTDRGGPNAAGTIFRMAPSGDLTVLHTFAHSDGAFPYGGLIQGSDGNLYGTTLSGGSGGYGTFFRMTLSGALTNLHNFTYGEGCDPQGVVEASDGNFYGTTDCGGAGYYGTVFQITPSGALTTLHSFLNYAGSDGSSPYGGLVQAADGNLYGTTYTGGLNGIGTVFRITRSGELTTLYSFAGNGEGSLPQAPLIQAADGNLYGTTVYGGANNRSAVFEIAPSGAYAMLHSLEYTEGAFVYGRLVEAADGNFYGVSFGGGANGSGTIFQMTPAGVLTTLHAFTSLGGTSLAPSRAFAGVIQAADGDFYGSTFSGGGGGVIFRLSPCARPTAIAAGTATIAEGSSTPLTGSGGVSCVWTPAAGLSDADSCSPTASPSATTTYTLTVFDSGGCASRNSPTVTVTVLPVPRLTVTKIVVNDNGATRQVSDFPLFVDGGSVASGVQNSFNTGPHTVSETSSPGYAARIGGDCAADGSITLNPGDVKNCTITNDDIAPKLTVTKIVVNNNGGTKQVSDFPLSVDGSPVTSGIQNTFNAGTHTVSEISSQNYAATFSGDCAADGRVVLNPGEVKSCTITNDDLAPPDLIVSAFSVPSAASAGLTIAVTDTTQNQAGAGSAGASITRFYLSANSSYDVADTPLGSRPIPLLAAGAASSGSTLVTIPAGTATATWYIIARADADGALAESSETNNIRSASIRISPPDLSVSSLSVPATGGAGLTIAVTDTTKNQRGTGPAAPSTTRFYLSANSTWETGDILLGGRSIPALAPATSSSGSTSLTVPAGTATGTWYVIARADGEDVIAETNETNNTRSATIAIGPDLIVSALSAPGTGGPGRPITVTDTSKNQGGGATPASTTKFYLSTNATFSPDDVFLGARAVGPLGPGVTSSGSTVLTIPAGTSSGTYSIIAVADAGGAVAETDETNNTRAVSIKLKPN